MDLYQFKKLSFMDKNKGVLIIVFFIFLIVTIFTYNYPSWKLSHKYFHDDTYYYLKIALNYLDRGYPTFDGLHKTNGFYPVWFLVLAPLGSLAKLSSSISGVSIMEIFPYFVIIICLVNLFVTSLFLNRIVFNKINYSYFFITSLILYSYSLSGMEISLSLLLLSAIIFLINKKEVYTLDFVLTGILAGLLFFTRYDSIIVAPVILIYLLKYKRNLINKNALVPLLLSLTLTTVIILCILYLSNIGLGSSSGKVKVWWALLNFNQYISRNGYSIQSFIGYLYSGFRYSLASHVYTMQGLICWISPNYCYSSDRLSIPKYLVYGLDVILVFLLIVNLIRSRKNRVGSELAVLAILLMLASVILITVSTILFYWLNIFTWYLWIGVLATSLLFGITIKNIYVNWPFLERGFSITFILISMVFCLIFNAHKPSGWAETYNVAVTQIDQINDRINVTPIVGTWAAGQIGYYATKKVINLEGLVTDDSILKLNKENRLDEYMRNLDYIIYNSTLPEIDCSELEFAKTFVITKVRLMALGKLYCQGVLDEIFSYKMKSETGEKNLKIYKITR